LPTRVGSLARVGSFRRDLDGRGDNMLSCRKMSIFGQSSNGVAARAAAALAVTACSACTYEVDCERAGESVDCTVQKWFAGVSTHSEQVRGVTGARLGTKEGRKGSTMTNVVLTTAQGREVEVSDPSGGMDSGQDGKNLMVAEINGFVTGKIASPLRVRTREGFFVLPLIVVVFGGAGASSILRKLREKLAVAAQQQQHPELLFAATAAPPDIRIYCRSCGEPVPGANIDMRNTMARCSACHAMFDVSAQIAVAGPSRPRRPNVPLPPDIEVRELGAFAMQQSMPYGNKAGMPAFEIVRRWFGADRIALLCFSLAWNSTVVFMLGQVRGAQILLLIAFLLPGLFLLYQGLAGLLNRTHIRAQEGRLTVRHGPVPWPGARDIDVRELTQLFVKEVVHKAKSPTYTYDVCALVRDTGQVALLKGLPAPAQALFLEQQLESRLGIVDVEVEGEYTSVTTEQTARTGDPTRVGDN
jgi:hypothetical protein